MTPANSELRQFLDGVLTQVKNISTPTDMSDVLDVLETERVKREFEFDTSPYWIWFGISAVLTTVFGFFLFGTPAIREPVYIAIGIALLIITCTPLFLVGRGNSLIKDISNRLTRIDRNFDNNLRWPEFDSDAKYSEHYKMFDDCRGRGDESQYISELTTGVAERNGRELEYELYTFHYVEVYYVPVTRTVGKTTTVTMERRTRTCYRHGFTIDLNGLVKDLAIMNSGGSSRLSTSWEPTDETFVDCFNTYCNRQQDASSFLEPAMVLEILKLHRGFSGTNIEFSSDGVMNISFNDDNVISIGRSNSIKEPALLRQELADHARLAKLERLLDFVEVVIKYNDDNFKGSGA